MFRPFLSLLVAVVGTVAGLASACIGAAGHLRASAAGADDPGAFTLLIVGALLLAVAAASVTIHWVGVMLVGAIHGLFGMLALTVPFGNPFAGGIFSPVFQITRMLAVLDSALSDGAVVFYFSGSALVVGAFLVGAALGVRSRRLAPPAGTKAVVVSSALGLAAFLGATGLLVAAGGVFVRMILVMMRYDAALAALTVLGGVLAGFAGLLLRWSSLGVVLASGLVVVAGLVVVGSPASADPTGYLGSSGLLVVVGATALAAALGGVRRAPDEVPAPVEAL